MRRPVPSYASISFGPGPLTRAVRAIVAANVIVYVLGLFAPILTLWCGLIPGAVLERGWVWQPVTYMFVHGGLFHLLFNMLALWMFGVELERVWGTTFFTMFYAVSGLGAAAWVHVELLPP